MVQEVTEVIRSRTVVGRSRERRCDVGVTESCTWLLRNKGTVERSPELGVKLNPTELSCVGPLRVQFSVLEFGL